MAGFFRANSRSFFESCRVAPPVDGFSKIEAMPDRIYTSHSPIQIWHNHTLTSIKKTMNVDEELFEQAKAASGATTDTETVRLGLQALVRRAAYERLRALRGTETQAQDAPRRREEIPVESSIV